jgi:hypothetical protein
MNHIGGIPEFQPPTCVADIEGFFPAVSCGTGLPVEPEQIQGSSVGNGK